MHKVFKNKVQGCSTLLIQQSNNIELFVCCRLSWCLKRKEYSKVSITTMENSTNSTMPCIPIRGAWVQILELILAIVGILGNSVVIHVFRRSHESIKSTTNTLVAALAVADLITSICIFPYPILSPVPVNAGGHFYCKVIRSSNIQWISIVASIFTLTILSVDRYYAIAHTSSYKKTVTLTTVRVIIIVIWLASFVINTFSYYVTYLDNNGQCCVKFPSGGFQIFIGVGLFIIEYLVPIIIMLVANIRTIQLLNAQVCSFSEQEGNEKSKHMLSLLRARRRVITMLFIVIISFIVCWSPNQWGFLAFNFGVVLSKSSGVWVGYLYGNLYSVFVVFAFANSCINPIIYTFVSKNFREAIKQYLPASMRSKKYMENTLFEIPFADSGAGETNISQKGFRNVDLESTRESKFAT